MPAKEFFADNPREVGLNPDKVQALFDRAERDVKEGVLPACQLAIARKGKIAALKIFGRAVQGGVEKPASDETVFVAMSATKAIGFLHPPNTPSSSPIVRFHSNSNCTFPK